MVFNLCATMGFILSGKEIRLKLSFTFLAYLNFFKTFGFLLTFLLVDWPSLIFQCFMEWAFYPTEMFRYCGRVGMLLTCQW